MRRILFLSIFIIAFITRIGLCRQYGTDSIIFKTEFERDILTNIDQYGDIEILLAISENATFDYASKIRDGINAFGRELDSKKFSAKNEEKKVKILFNLTHKWFFQKYREGSTFDRIFDVKEYNCVSATALYAIMLKEYNIPFVIKETPTHVYSLAYPKTKGIVLESTAPKDGYYYLDDNDVRKVVNSLVESKYFTKDEVSAKGVRNIYNEHFFSKDDINIRELAGLQYYNEAVAYLANKEYEQALNSGYKLELLYPSKRAEYLKYVILTNILSESDMDKLEDIAYLAQYANLPVVDASRIANTYRKVVNKQLFSMSNVSFISSAYDYLSANLKDSVLMKTLSEIHYAEFGRFYAQIAKFDKSLEYASKAYVLNHKDVNTQALITQSIVQDLAQRAGNISTISKMEEYSERFSFLRKNSFYQSLYFHAHSYIAFNYLSADDIKNGLKQLGVMESLIEEFGSELKIDENRFGLVYAEAGAAYFREGKYKQAEEIIRRGLDIMPEHPELKVRLEIVIEEMKNRGL